MITIYNPEKVLLNKFSNIDYLDSVKEVIFENGFAFIMKNGKDIFTTESNVIVYGGDIVKDE